MYIYGRNSVFETLKSKTDIQEIIYANNISSSKIIDSIFQLAEKKNINIQQITPVKLQSIVGENANHQGIVAKIEDYNYKSLQDITSNRVLILDHIQDPQNFGAIIRSAAAFGFTDIIIPKDRSVSVNETVYKVAVGALESVNIILTPNLVNAIKYLKDNKFWIIGMALSDKTTIETLDYTDDENLALVLGNEGSGICDLVLKNCDIIAKIPFDSKAIESLNVSVAAGIAMYSLK